MLITQEGYGTLRIANHLNMEYPDPNKIWTAQTIRSILRNPMYTGRMHMNEIQSEPIETLRLVTDEQFHFAEYVLKRHIATAHPLTRQKENESLPEDAPTKTSVYGASMLSGILYCAHCGHKLVGGYCTKQRNGSAYHRPVYRCYNGAVKAKQCTGQSVYSAAKVEGAILPIVHQYFATINQSVDAVWREQARRQMRAGAKSRRKTAEQTLERLKKEQDGLKKEILKAISGMGSFDMDLLKEMLDENKKAQDEAFKAIQDAEKEIATEEDRLQMLTEQYRHISNWANEFDATSAETKKMILARLIERIEVDRNYHLTVKFFLTPEDFM